ncbi:hypothetical protein KL86DPRO_20271 [uncultured delta proteobacterium]|uniref:Uncharacterized protein n=1 Tax=uncultured delta proteobacterium TaxID=34034 RepID=A0A212JXH5_9DELT|nr:hypothetical protein KL86DPRO_20271 [uncultured delta proteobacterium]
MMATHELWRSILECNDRGLLSSGAWKALRAIAERMTKEDFSSGNAKEQGEKLIKALGYDGWHELKEESKLQRKIESINNCIQIAKEKYNGSLSMLFQKEKVYLVDGYASQSGGLRKFYRVLDSIGISRKSVDDNVLSLERILFDDVFDSGTPLDKFREEKLKHTVRMLMKAQLKKRECTKPQDK